MTKMLVFDMDGTIANFYGVKGWLEYLQAENTLPYDEAEPLYDMVEFVETLNKLREIGYRIAITSWLSKCGSDAFMKAIRKSKRAWLEKYDFPYDEIHLVKYGTRKDTCTKGKADYQILFDDSEEVRETWRAGETINANEDILKILKKMLA